MEASLNPFLVSGYFSSKYFCDRKTETGFLIRKVTNGNNVAIVSPRRMGKTGLIRHCFYQEQIRKNYYTFLIDIYATGDLRELAFILGKEIFNVLKPKGRKLIDTFFEVITSLRPAFKFDQLTGEPVFDIGLGEIRKAEFTLDEIFCYLEAADKPCILAIDEFQQITNYPEKNVEAVLRTKIQQCKQTYFIFAGSQQHVMTNIFSSPSHPFYQSVTMMQLGCISEELYSEFVMTHFREANKIIASEQVMQVYDQFDGHTWYLQKVFNELFSLMVSGDACTSELLSFAIEGIISSQEFTFQEVLSRLPERQKEVLIAIAKEGKAENITSAFFVKKHSLLSSSSVQAAVKYLIGKDMILVNGNVYQVYDRFFGMWIADVFG